VFRLTNRVVNPVLARVLASGAGRVLGRRLAVVEYLGRRSGEHRRLVTLYRRAGSAIEIPVGLPDRKAWWRNFAEPRPIHLHVAGQQLAGTARAVRDAAGVRVVVDVG
jgi:hypothetical protein